MTTIALPEVWSFRGTDLSSYAVMTRVVDGADAFPTLRGEDFVVPGRPGRTRGKKQYDSHRIALGLWVTHLTAAGAEGATPSRQARANLDALYAVLADRTPGALVRTMPDASTRTATAECVQVGDIRDPAGRELIGLVADFALADPFFYTADVVDSNRVISASPTDFTLTHPGTVEGHRVVFDFEGPITNPRVTNQANAVYVEVLVTVAATKHLVIDCAAVTALNDGANVIGSLRHSGSPLLMVVKPGAQTMRVTGTGMTAATKLSTTFKPPWMP